MRRCRDSGLAGLAAVLMVAVVRAQVQQEPLAETTELTGITINCSHANMQAYDYIHWYRQLPGRAPELVVISILRGSKDVVKPPGRLTVAGDRRSSALRLDEPRLGDAAVYYCALGDTARGAAAAAGHEPPPAALRGQVWSGPLGGAAALPNATTSPCSAPASARFSRSQETGTFRGKNHPMEFHSPFPCVKAPGKFILQPQNFMELSKCFCCDYQVIPLNQEFKEAWVEEGDVELMATCQSSRQWLGVERMRPFDRTPNIWS